MHRSERGLTVPEVLVALSLISIVFAATGLLTSRTISALGTATERDGAQQLANTMVEEAKVYGCGLTRGDEGTSILADTRARCWGGVGDSEERTTVGVTTFVATLHTAWKQVDAGSAGCVDPNAAADRPKPLLAEADGLEREVTVRWGAHEVVAQDYEAVPPDAVAYRDTSRGGLLLEGAAGAVATVKVSSGDAITRIVDSTGCAFFPFLPATGVEWAVGPSRGTVTVVSEGIVTEPGGRVTA